MPIRPYRPSDLPALFAINQASTPGVGHEESADGLKRWIDISTCLVAADENDTPLGFITLLEPHTKAYASDNLRWMEDWMAREETDMIYVDRIALAEAARGQRLGQALYAAAFEHARGRKHITCEVNTDPDNPGSHRFHQRLGFVEVGRKRYKPDYEVAYYARPVAD
ncbi:GNAT family N-acetyltransferase [Henriciella litoralis]|uniref:GNAT family N-acetyltransferase n=1 Tax=Henriciella litoralis TaxID=568102 RepID=UPI0009FE4C77|nr:GNAT family N-acetyltransferase [Henriciella litoralis]